MTGRHEKAAEPWAPPRHVDQGSSGVRGVACLLQRVRGRVLDLTEHLAGRRADDPPFRLGRRKCHADRRADRECDGTGRQRALLHHVLRLTRQTLRTAADLTRDAAGHIADVGSAAPELVGHIADLVTDAAGLHLVARRLAAGPSLGPAVSGVPALRVHAIARAVAGSTIACSTARAPLVHRAELVHPAVGAVGPEPCDAEAGHGCGDRVLLDGLEDAAPCLLDGRAGATECFGCCAGHVAYLSDGRLADGARRFLHDVRRCQAITDGFDRPGHLIPRRFDVGLESSGVVVLLGALAVNRVRGVHLLVGHVLIGHRTRSFAHSTSSSIVSTVRRGTRSAFFNRSRPVATMSPPATATTTVTMSVAIHGATPASTKRRTIVARRPSSAA